MQAETAQEFRTVDILFVDDDRTSLMILSRSLERSNFSVATANSAGEALEMLKTLRPEVILADVSMPGMDGFDFFRSVRMMGLSDVPFIFCSGRDGALDRILGLRLGADDYLVKPIALEEVALKVRLQITKMQYLRALKAALERKDNSSIMNGNFGGMSVVDVLQTARMLGSGEYAVRFTTEEDSGAVYLKHGQVLHAETGWFSGLKAFSRLLVWERGKFQIENRIFEDDPTINSSLEELLLDQLAQIDEVRQLRGDLESYGQFFTVVESAAELTAPESRICELVKNSPTLNEVFAHSEFSDKETAELLLGLVRNKVLQATAEP